MLYPVIPLLQHLLPKFLRQDVYIIQNLLAISDAVTFLVGITKASVFFLWKCFQLLMQMSLVWQSTVFSMLKLCKLMPRK